MKCRINDFESQEIAAEQDTLLDNFSKLVNL